MKLKLIFLIQIFCLSVTSLYADSGGPDAFGYKWRDSQEPGVTYNFLDTNYGAGTWTRVNGLGDDNFVGPLSIGFSFRFYNISPTRFWIGSNGYIKFDSTGNLASPFPIIPAPALPNNLISAYGCDINFLGPENPGKCYVYRNNIDTLIVSFYNAPFWMQSAPGYTGSITFQIVMTSTDSTIKYSYKERIGILMIDDITIGIENSTGLIGLQYLRNLYPTSGRSVKFFPPSALLGVTTSSSIIPTEYKLEQNYPNPFNPTTKIGFSIPKSGNVKLIIYDNLGREVFNILNNEMQPGAYEYEFNGETLNSGVYFYKLQINDFIQTKKMLLVK